MRKCERHRHRDASDDGSFYNTDIDVRLRADVPPSGPIKTVSIEQRQLKMTYQRI